MHPFALALPSGGGGEIDHVHGVYTHTKHGRIHIIYRWFFSAPVYRVNAGPSERQRATMGLAEELYFALMGYTARRCKTLSQTMIDTARDWLERG